MLFHENMPTFSGISGDVISVDAAKEFCVGVGHTRRKSMEPDQSRKSGRDAFGAESVLSDLVWRVVSLNGSCA